MNLEEFAFVNQQLAGMLRAGIPLEGALRRTCETMAGGALRTELGSLEADLARGTPLRQALTARNLPEFYSRMLEVGARGRDLPALLTMLADYYQRAHLTWLRLKGLVFYPAMVLLTSFAVSLLVAITFATFSREMLGTMSDLNGGSGELLSTWTVARAALWLPVSVLALATGLAGLTLVVPRWREWARWHLPGFREARLSNLASAMSLLLQNGASPAEAVSLVQGLEAGSPVEADVARWRQRMGEGQTRFEDVAAGGRLVPPMFVWLVAASGENWVAGFRHAADVYHERAVHRSEMVLYALLPISLVVLGCLIVMQLFPMARVFSLFVRMLVTFDGP